MKDMKTLTCCLVGAATISGVLFFCSSARSENSAEIQTAIDTLISTNACVGCDLAGADLNRLDLTGADLSNADLREARFFLADLTEVNFSGAVLHGAQFGGADLSNADFRGADLRGAMFAGAYMVGSKMDGSIAQAPLDEDSAATETVYVPDEATSKSVITQDDVALEPDSGSADTLDEQIVGKETGSGPAALLAAHHEPAKKEPAPLIAATVINTPKKASMTNSTDTDGARSDPVAAASSNPAQTDLDKQDEAQQSPGFFARLADFFSSDEDEKKQQAGHTEPTGIDRQNDSESLSTVSEETVSVEETELTGKSDETPLTATPSPTDVYGEPQDSGSDSPRAADLAEPSIPVDLADTSDTSTATGQISARELESEAPQEMVAAEEVEAAIPEAEALVLLDPDTDAIRLGNRETLLDNDRCYGCDLRGVDLSGKRVTKADLEGADLSGANLRGTDFSRANLKGVLFRRADARGAKFRRADLYQADFTGANLADADFDDAEVDGAVFTGAVGYGGAR